jgi:hypothetical protein
MMGYRERPVQGLPLEPPSWSPQVPPPRQFRSFQGGLNVKENSNLSIHRENMLRAARLLLCAVVVALGFPIALPGGVS